MAAEPAARELILGSLAASRDVGVRFYRDYMGIRAADTEQDGCGSVLLARRPTLGQRGALHPGALATLADVALARVLRRQIASHQRVATFGLTLRVVRETPTTRVDSCAETIFVDDQVGIARCRMSGDNGMLLAEATGSFAIRIPLHGTEWRMRTDDSPLEGPGPRPLQPGELDQEELEIMEHAENASRMQGSYGPYVDFLGLEWLDRGEGRGVARWPLGPHLWNRSGHVHGGAVFGALAAAATACLPATLRPQLLEQHVQYVRPTTGEGIQIEAELLRQGQRLMSVEAAILDARHRTIARALTTLQSSEEADQ